MKKILDLITEELEQAFEEAGYEKELAKVTLSNRPDLCEYQCNGAMAGAKKYHKAPIMIAEEVVAKITGDGSIREAEAVKPGFINLKTNPDYIAGYLNEMAKDDKFGVEEEKNPKTILIDYGGPNVAKPLHVGHLRSAIIGESIKRITRFMGNRVTGDIHLGDWGYQMGLIITELRKRQPNLPENIRKNRRLRSVIWRKSILLHPHMPRSMKTIVRRLWRLLSSCRTGKEDTVQSGIIL